MGHVQTRQDEPELLHQRPVGHHCPVLRGDRQAKRSHPRRPQPARGAGLREGRRVERRALRRHHHDLPQQLVPRRSSRNRAHVRVGGGRRGEVAHRLQHGQPRRHPRSGRSGAQAASAPRRDLPEGRDAVQRQSVVHAQRAVGNGRAEGGRRSVRRIRTYTCESAAGARVRLPSRQRRGCRCRSDCRSQRCRPERTEGRARCARSEGPGDTARQMGRAAQGRSGAVRDRRVRVHGRGRRRCVERHQARPGQARHRGGPRRVQGRRRDRPHHLFDRRRRTRHRHRRSDPDRRFFGQPRANGRSRPQPHPGARDTAVLHGDCGPREDEGEPRSEAHQRRGPAHRRSQRGPRSE